MANIPLFYRIFFLCIDPLICLSSIYFFIFGQHTFIQNGVPSAISSQVSPTSTLPLLIEHLIMSLGSYSVFVFVMQVLLLRQIKDAPRGLNVEVWRKVQFGILLIDLGLLCGVYIADPRAFLDVRGWKSGDRSNKSILCSVVSIRSAFLAGIGGVGVIK